MIRQGIPNSLKTRSPSRAALTVSKVNSAFTGYTPPFGKAYFPASRSNSPPSNILILFIVMLKNCSVKAFFVF
jgi:hypothetical protein